MVFPSTPLDLKTEINLGGTWTNITSYVYTRDDVVITRGRSDEAEQAERSTARLTLDNRDGRFSPRNPAGPYYGNLTRNTPIRLSVPYGATYLRLLEELDRVTCPDAAALGITGDIDVRIDLTAENVHGSKTFAGKYVTSGDQRSWALYLPTDGSGYLYFRWSTAGTLATVQDRSSTVPIPIPADGRQALRAVLDANNGAGGHTVTFYYADTIAGPWTQLGDAVTTAGVTSIFDSTAGLEVGDVVNLASGPVLGKIHKFELRDPFTVVANPDFSIQTAGAASFADTASTPNTWTLQLTAELTDRMYRFHGEVSAWPVGWDPSGADVYVPIEAAGILRRLGQGASPLQSTLYRGLSTLAVNRPVAYWPCEDAEGSKTLASGIGGPPMSITRATPNFAAYDDFDASAPIPTLNDAVWSGQVPAYTVTGDATIRFLMAIPSGGISGDQALITVYTSGTAPVWTIRYDDPTGNLKVQAYDEEGATILDSGFISYDTLGEQLRVALDLDQNGANVDWDLSTLVPGATTGFTGGGTLASRTVGQVKRVTVNLGGGITDTAIGHISVQPSITSIFDIGDLLEAYAGETATDRLFRLCEEEGISFRWIGRLATSARMGAQRPATLVDLVQECADADMGMLYEPRDVFGLGHRTRESLYNQGAAITLDYTSSQVAVPLDPTEDDQLVRNDITATRQNGSSARITLDTGALSTLAPPSGVGRYDEALTLNCQYDEQLSSIASWRLHTGTVDEMRFPQISVNLASDAIAGNAALLLNVLEADVGGRISITNVPSWLPPEGVSQIIQGYTERLSNFAHEITFNCSPASPYEVAVYGTSRYGPHDTVTNEALDTTETGVDITTPTGPLWSTSPGGNFDIMIGGERMTVTAVGAAAGTVQTLTVTRSVNGVVKSHATGAAVELFQPAYRALYGGAVKNIEDGDLVRDIDTPRTVHAQDDTVQSNVASTSFISGTPELGVRFIAPNSGRVLLTIGGGMRDETNDNGIYMAPEILEDDLVSVFLAASYQAYGITSSRPTSDYVFQSRVSLIEGLTPGRVYYARVMQAADITTSASADIAVREISVEPTP